MSRTAGAAGRATRRWQALAASIRAEQLPCWICTKPIDYDAPPRTRWSFSVDHIHPLQTHPWLAEDEGNLAPAHYGCNAARRPPTHRAPEATRPSRKW